MNSLPRSMAVPPPVPDAIVPEEQPRDNDGSRDFGAPTKDDMLLQIPAKLDAVEKELRFLSRNPYQRQRPYDARYEPGNSIIDHTRHKQNRPWPVSVSTEIAMCNLQQFKTIFCAENTPCAVDALISSTTLDDDVDGFMASLKRSWEKRDFRMEHAKRLDISDADAVDAFPPAETWIQEVRVNSHAVLSVLDRFSYQEGSLVKEPHIFRRPFLYFIQNYEKIYEELRTIESQRRPSATSVQNPAVPQRVSKSMDTIDRSTETGSYIHKLHPGDDDKSSDIARSAEELRCFCRFVRKYIMPKYEKLRDDEFARKQKIHFDDLPFIFRPGELVYLPEHATHPDKLPELSAQRRSAGQQTILRLRHLKISRQRVGPLPNKPKTRPFPGSYQSPGEYEEYNITKGLQPVYGFKRILESWDAFCFYIDFDGDFYGAVSSHDLKIPFFQKAVHITELPFYPARFMESYADAMKEAEEHGKKMVEILSESAKHAHYSGWTLTHGPMGTSIENSKGDRVRFPEHIESDIIVDYDEAFNHMPEWRPLISVDLQQDSRLLSTIDTIPLVRWSTPSPYEPLEGGEERLIYDDPMHRRQWNECLKSDTFWKGIYQSHSLVRLEDLVLLPHRIFAYSLWDRKFVQLDPHFVNRRLHEGQEGQSFQQLQIEQRSKDVIESLLYNHFNDMKAERSGVVVESQDLIRGKGRGVSILLHGKPGVGKTATAEAVAEKWDRPLFPITCGDLGYEADSVETKLNEIFRLAHLWGCILLLDEADIFITQRTNQELQRNALVSVFLRMLEYYNGILFLTTNRTGVLDEAIKSRIHLHLGFDDLNEHQTVEIFKNNIGRLRARDQQRKDAIPDHKALHIDVDGVLQFAESHYRSCNTIGRWNGRQIRNAFVVASSLANFEAEKRSPDWQPQLRAEHFHTVLEATMHYDRYRQSVFNMSDDSLAFNRMERAEPSVAPPMSATYGFAHNGTPFSSQQEPYQQVPSVPSSMQYGGSTGAAFAYGAMHPPSTTSFPYNAAFARGAQVPGPTQAGPYPGQSAFGQGQPVPITQAQGQMYSQQHRQPSFDTAASAQSLGRPQEQSATNPGGNPNLHTGAVEPVYTGGAMAAPAGWGSGQGQTQPPHMQHRSVEGA